MSQSVKRLLKRSRSSSSAAYGWIKRAALSISALRLLVLHLSTFQAIYLTIFFLGRLFTVTSPTQTPRFRRTFALATPRFLWRAFFASIATFADRLFFSVVGSATGSLSWAARGVSFPFAAIPAPTERLLLLPAPAKSFQKNHWPLEALPSGSVQAISLWIKNQVQYIIQPSLATIPIQYSLQMRTQKAMSMLRHSWSVQDAWCWAMPGSASSWASPVNASPEIHAKAQNPCTNVRVRDGFKFKCVVSATWWLRPPEPGFSDPWP